MERLTMLHFREQIELFTRSSENAGTLDKLLYVLITEQSLDTVRMDTQSFDPKDKLPKLEFTGMSGIMPICRKIR